MRLETSILGRVDYAPTNEAMQAFTGQRENDASAVADYFAPLNTWLTAQNRGKDCGWET